MMHGSTGAAGMLWRDVTVAAALDINRQADELGERIRRREMIARYNASHEEMMRAISAVREALRERRRMIVGLPISWARGRWGARP